MSWTNVRLIFLREVRDQLRDRRTLFMVAVLPLLLYPALGIGMFQMTVTFSEQLRRVVVIGADQLPAPSFLAGDRIDGAYFDHPEDAAKLLVVTDAEDDPGLQSLRDNEVKARLREFLVQGEVRRAALAELAQVQSRLDQLKSAEGHTDALLRREAELRRDLEDWFNSAPAQVLLVFPPDFRARSEEANAAFAASESVPPLPQPVVLHNSADEKSEIAYQRVRGALRRWEAQLLDSRLAAAGLPASLTHPLPLTSVDLAEPEQIAANVWSKIFPALLVIMSVTGAFYPAIDLGAGEKERGTMETLLISPATRTEIVFGKFLTVMLFSLSTALLNLVSMGFTGRHILSAIGSAKSTPLGDLSFPPAPSLMWVVLLALPLAALFSALSLSLAMFARSSKEGQYYLTPLLMVTMGLTMFCINPAVELNAYYSVFPVIGPGLLLKSLLLGGQAAATAALYAVPVLATSIAYSGIALWWAVDQFQREDILFREAERFEVGLWLRHLLREKEPTPTFGEAAACFIVIALVQFLFMTSMQRSPDLLSSPTQMVTVQLIYLIATVGMPPVLMAVLLTSRARSTLKLRWPAPRHWAYGLILPITLTPCALELMERVKDYLPPPPAGAEHLMAAMADAPFWLAFAAFALAPALCEELAFRGFILTGLQRSRHKWLPIVVSALLFGVIHLIPRQQFNASLLGLVLGLLAVKSGSLWPGMLFHAIFNGVQVMLSQVSPATLRRFESPWLVRFAEVDGETEATFSIWLLLGCVAISTWVIMRLLREPDAEMTPAEEGGVATSITPTGSAPEHRPTVSAS